MKNFLTIILVIIALVAAYAILTASSKSTDQHPQNNEINQTSNYTQNTSEIEFGSNLSIDSDVFLVRLEEAQNIAIVQDLRNVNDSDIKRNILQCGTDFAGSSEFGYLMQVLKRNVTIYALEDSKCTTLDGIFDLKTCLNQIKNSNISIHVKSGKQYAFYENKFVVGIEKEYTAGTCGIRRTSQPRTVRNQTSNQTNSS